MRKSIHRQPILKPLLACVAATLLGNALGHAQPTGTRWDCVVSGKGQQGLAFLTFADDGTFSGYQLFSTQPKKGSSSDPRGPYTDTGRTNDDGTNTVSNTALFGFFPTEGRWGYDANGRVIGNFPILVQVETTWTTNYASTNWTVTNPDGSVTTISNTVAVPVATEEAKTNMVSFSGRVTPGKRLTLVASTANGKLTYSGVPYRDVPALDGAWYGTKVKGKQSFVEFFELLPTEEPGIYQVAGEGAGYAMEGFAMFSSRGRAGFDFKSSFGDISDPSAWRSTSFGNFSVSRGAARASTSGIEESEESQDRITFKASSAP